MCPLPDPPTPPAAATDRAPGPEALQRTAETLLPLLYGELRRTARRVRWRLSSHDTLQTTELVHEAYLKLKDAHGFADAQHFLRAGAMAMRHILINAARAANAAKRGDGAPHVPLDDVAELLQGEDGVALLELQDALEQLEAFSPRLAAVVECRFFAGYSEIETARALGLTDRTVRRDWTKARAWLQHSLAGTPPRAD
jgi:RNA polymerase sigma factor (TIGR02999 family)